MKTIMLLILCTLSAQATIIPVDLGPPRKLDHDIFVSNNALNGTPLNGQKVSLDYQFSNLIHLFQTTSGFFNIEVRAQTNMTPIPDGIYPSVNQLDGYAIRLNGSPTQHMSFENDKLYGTNITEVILGLIRPAEGYCYLTGMHFDLILPELQGVQITGLKIHIDPAPQRYWNSHWTIASSVPDVGATISLLALGLLGIAGFRRA